jgi:D-arabinose 1-dehydrogenase-like Zn-dependent alcohol dehydrogenase
MQFANSLGFRTVAITRHRQGGALKLGAHYFIDSATDDVTDAFNHSGGVQPR